MTSNGRKWGLRGALAAVIVAAAVILWSVLSGNGYGPGIAAGNGRLEATELRISAEAPGRIDEMLVDEGDVVEQGQVVARMDGSTLQAQRDQAQAQKLQAQTAVASALAQVAQRRSEKASALAQLRQQEANLTAARQRLNRSSILAKEGGASLQELDQDTASMAGQRALVDAAKAQIRAVNAAISAAQAQVRGAEANVAAADAALERIESDLTKLELRAPRSGRVQYRVVQTGEVVGAGSPVLSMVDMDDIYMSFFLPEQQAGQLSLGSEARLVLDAAPDTVIPARISYVADVAQFTPKEVETESERQKLMFRVRAQIAPDIAERFRGLLKSGLPGMAYARLDKDVAWPADLQADGGK